MFGTETLTNSWVDFLTTCVAKLGRTCGFGSVFCRYTDPKYLTNLCETLDWPSCQLFVVVFLGLKLFRWNGSTAMGYICLALFVQVQSSHGRTEEILGPDVDRLPGRRNSSSGRVCSLGSLFDAVRTPVNRQLDPWLFISVSIHGE